MFLTAAGTVSRPDTNMAPEQARGQKGLTTAADVYALGAILYALLTGRSPFESDNVMQTLRGVMESPAASPRSVNPGVPRDLAVVCLKCLEKEEGRRYASAEALADDLRRFVENRPIQARRVGGAERLARWARRNPAVATLASGMAALALALLGLAVGAAVYLSGANADLKQASESAEREAENARQALGRESRALRTEGEERKRAAAADLAQQRLGSLYVENGLRAEGPTARLSWFAEALRWDHDDPRRAEAHRLRVLAHLPDARPEVSLPFPSNILINPATGEGPRESQYRSALPQLSYSPTRRYAVVRGTRYTAVGAAEKSTDVWDLTTGERIFQDRGWAEFCLDDRRLLLHDRVAPLGSGRAQLWDLEKRRPLTPLLDTRTQVLPGSRRVIGPAPFQASGNVNDLPRRLTVWSAETGEELFAINLPFSAWDFESEQLSPREHPWHNQGLRMSLEENGKEGVVVFHGFDSGRSRTAAWDLATGQPVDRKQAPNPAPAPAPKPGADMESPLGTGHLVLWTSLNQRLLPNTYDGGGGFTAGSSIAPRASRSFRRRSGG